MHARSPARVPSHMYVPGTYFLLVPHGSTKHERTIKQCECVNIYLLFVFPLSIISLDGWTTAGRGTLVDRKMKL